VKPLPEIDPEIRGLLEELVSDPRASIRLVPKRALRPWLESSDSASSRDVSENRLARHLIEAHREALAKVLLEASQIAYWKAPVLSHPPVGKNGEPYDVAVVEAEWKERGQRHTERMSSSDAGVELLRQCLEGIAPGQGYDLAWASQSLVPSDAARVSLAGHLVETQPRASLHRFQRIARSTSSRYWRGIAWSEAASRLCQFGAIDLAVQAYEHAAEDWPNAWFYLFNLACYQGDAGRAQEAARGIERYSSAHECEIARAVEIIKKWLGSRPPAEITSTRHKVLSLRDGLPDSARKLEEAYV
jgi:hypothetical protein